MRKNPAPNGPSWFEVIFGAVLSVALGGVLGLLLLAFAPVTVVKALPSEEERDPKAVYFVEGSRESNKARNAPAKRAAFLDGQSVTLSEDELNVLAGPPTPFHRPKPAPAKPGAPPPPPPATPAKADEDTLTMGTANFRLQSDKIQIAVPVTVNLLGLGQKIVVQSEGAFVKHGDLFAYDPATLFIGACPVHRVPYLSSYAREKVLAQKIPDPLAASWAKLANVTVEDKTLRLKMP
ncbi:MAG: hypothetical protein ABIQ12_14895 [Opitutaceae bacterium]